MVYLDTKSREQLHNDLAKFIETASHPALPENAIR